MYKATNVISIPHAALAGALLMVSCSLSSMHADEINAGGNDADDQSMRRLVVRVATFNVSLYGRKAGEVRDRLRGGSDPQARHLAEIIQRVHPDVLLLNEIDYDDDHETLRIFRDEYLAVGQRVSQSRAGQSSAGPAKPSVFPHFFSAPTNTGVSSGFDLDNNGEAVTAPGRREFGADCWGYGLYPGQYGMAILSRFPIDQPRVRTFQNFLWKDMPGAQLPDDPATPNPPGNPAPGDWYTTEELAEFRLSSKSHWDVPVAIGDRSLHLLASHPTPPTFDGAEDRNGLRNRDEIRFWLDYTGPPHRSAYVYDDQGRRGGLNGQPSFVILGDLNGDPHDGQGSAGIAALLAAPQLLKYEPPASAGGSEQAQRQAGANARHEGKPQYDTLDASDDDAPNSRGPGNLRVDYVLPSAKLRVLASGVFWPAPDDEFFPLVGDYPFPSSDHRMVWVDLAISDGEQE